MLGIAIRTLVALELVAAWLLAGLPAFFSIIGPLGSHQEFGSLNQWGRIFALLSLFPLSFSLYAMFAALHRSSSPISTLCGFPQVHASWLYLALR